MDSRRKLGGLAVLALVLLRLAIGWHFFSEGRDKLEYDPTTGRYRLVFSADRFLTQAKGPLADVFHSLAPNGHGWQSLLAIPHQHRETDKPRVPYQAWANRIAEDWQAIVDNLKAIPRLTDEQRQRAAAVFERRQKELTDYLASEAAAIVDYQHELWRLEQWRQSPEAAAVPFQQERIATKAAETAAAAKPWINQVFELEAGFLADLRGILTPEQRSGNLLPEAMDEALTSPRQARLDWVNQSATALTIGVGICLLLGLFTRLASLAGAVFLVSIIATQPPWLATSEPTIDQTVELAGLLVLAGTGAGRWLGLDYFSWAFFHRHDEDDD